MTHLMNWLVREAVGCSVMFSTSQAATCHHIRTVSSGPDDEKNDNEPSPKRKFQLPTRPGLKPFLRLPIHSGGLNPSGCHVFKSLHIRRIRDQYTVLFFPAFFFSLPFVFLSSPWGRTPVARELRPGWKGCLKPMWSLGEGETCQAVKNGISVGWPEIGCKVLSLTKARYIIAVTPLFRSITFKPCSHYLQVKYNPM